MSVFVLECHAAIGAGRGPLIEMLRDRWGPHIDERLDLQLIGLWAGVGSTGDWPHVWSLTRAADEATFARAFDTLYPMESRSTYAYEVWRHSLRSRSGGRSWLLDAASELPSPGGAPLLASVTMVEQVIVRPGRLGDYQRAVRDIQVPLHAGQGVELVGSFVERLSPHSVVNLWSTPNWQDLAAPYTTADPEAAAWFTALDELTESAWSCLLAAAPKSTLGT